MADSVFCSNLNFYSFSRILHISIVSPITVFFLFSYLISPLLARLVFLFWTHCIHRFGTESLLRWWGVCRVPQVPLVLETAWVCQIRHVSLNSNLNACLLGICVILFCGFSKFHCFGSMKFSMWLTPDCCSWHEDLVSVESGNHWLGGSFVPFWNFFPFCYRYPHAFFFLDMLQSANFRAAMAHPANKVRLRFWYLYRCSLLSCSISSISVTSYRYCTFWCSVFTNKWFMLK